MHLSLNSILCLFQNHDPVLRGDNGVRYVQIRTLPDLGSSYVTVGAPKVVIEYAWIRLCMYIKGSPNEIQTSKHQNLSGRNITIAPPWLSPSNILPPFSSHCVFVSARKKSSRFKNYVVYIYIYIYIFFFFYTNCCE